MKPFCCLVLLLASYYSFSQTSISDKRLKGLDTIVNRVLKEWHAPGVSIAVVEKNKVVFAGGFGYADYEKKTPVTANTLFAIGSCSKAFTASMIGMLEKEGALDIDKPVRDYLPELRFYNDYLNDHVTMRDMMCHRTGLPRHDNSWYGSTASRKELLQRIQYLEPTAELREKYQYNNFMFMSLGVVIEKLTGKSWEQNLAERILQPLGMTHTIASVKDMDNVSDKSWAYSTDDDEIKLIPYRNIDAIGPAGSINSCANDMANWLITWINNGKFNDKEIIPASFRAQAIAAQMATGGGIPGSQNADLHGSGYGFAWGVSSYRGHYRVEHGGGIDGFITTTSFFPSDSIGVFVVSNQSGPSTSIRNYIVDKMLGLGYRDWSNMQLMPILNAKKTNTLKNTDSIEQVRGTSPSHPLTKYTGEFENKGYGIIKIFNERDTTWLQYNDAGDKGKTYLQHYHYDVFRIRSTEEKKENFSAPKVKFNTDYKGDIVSLSSALQPDADDIVFERKEQIPELTRKDLEKYTGDYQLAAATVSVYVKGENTLVVLVPGQPEYELVPVEKDLFKLKILDGFSLKFDVPGGEKATGASFIQPNGTFKATRKK